MSWSRQLDRKTARGDLVAGLTAGVLILPQAIALATLAGLPPEHGLYTAIFPVVIVCLFGSSWQSLSGPNTALAVFTGMAVAPFASIGSSQYVQYALTLTFMAGALQLAWGVLRLGVVFNYFSHTVMTALVTAVGVIIVVQQCGNFMGVLMNPNEDFHDMLRQIGLAIARANPYAVTVATLTVVSGLTVRRLRPTWPHYIVAVAVGMAAAQVIHALVGASNARIDMLGHLDFSALPWSAPDFSPENFAEFANFAYPAAISMAVLGSMQSAVIARSLAAQSGQEGLNINREVAAQGLSNIIGSFLSCFISCGSFNRSAANLQAGARTPLAGLVSAVVLALLVFLAAPWIAWLPLPMMAGVLMLVGMALIKPKEIRQTLATPGSDRILFAVIFVATLFGGIDDGVYLGIVMSVVNYLRGVSHPEVKLMSPDPQATFLQPGMRVETTTVVSVAGSLFFGSTERLERALADIARHDGRRKNLILLCHCVTGTDASGATVLVREAIRRREAGRAATIWMRPEHLTDPIVRDALYKGFGVDGVICRSPYREREARPEMPGGSAKPKPRFTPRIADRLTVPHA